MRDNALKNRISADCVTRGRLFLFQICCHACSEERQGIIMSTIFRVEKHDNFTIMSNIHLKDRRLTYKAKGLMSEILSLPPDWDYTLAGLAVIANDGVDSVRAAVRELEQYGYLARSQSRDGRGRMSVNEYKVYENPADNPNYTTDNGKTAVENSVENSSRGSVMANLPSLENPTTAENFVENPVENSENLVEKPLFSDNPLSGKPSTDLPLSENPTTATFNKLNNQVLNTHQSNHSVICAPREDRIDRIDFPKEKKFFGDERAFYREIIHKNIEYDYFIENRNCPALKIDLAKVDELVEIMVDVICSKRETIRVNGADMPHEVVKSRFLALNQEHIEYVMDALKTNTSAVRNIRAYLITTLYNSPVTMDNYYEAMVQHDLYGK